jgi:peroxiredoxin
MDRLPLSEAAPNFTLAYTPSARLTLRDLRGRRVVIVFYPYDWEAVTREQLTLYQQQASDFARLDARLLGISADHVWSHMAFAHDARIQFPLLADVQPRGAVARAYGVYRSGVEASARSLFVLDRQGVIRMRKVYPDQLNPGAHGVLRALEALAAAQDSG